MSNGSTARVPTDRQTDSHTHTDGTDFIPSTADAEGKRGPSCGHENGSTVESFWLHFSVYSSSCVELAKFGCCEVWS